MIGTVRQNELAREVDSWESMNPDAERMRLALSLAVRGQGAVEPNPMVGAVVVDRLGEIVGSGYHQRFGGPHAEIEALAVAGERAAGSTVYVTLEPCCHFGKTPPCTEALIGAGVRRVVAAMADPFPRVDGGGLEQLRRSGVEVEVGLLEAEARQLNAPYLKRLQSGMPWVIAKWAMTLDGRIATRTGDSQWISGAESRQKVHELRGRVDAIMVGSGTLIADDPALTARPPGPRTATRVVVSGSGQLPTDRQLLRTARETPVLIVTCQGNEPNLTAWTEAGAELLVLPADPTAPTGHQVPIVETFQELGRRGMTNVLVEGGAKLLGTLLDADIVDEVWAFVAPMLIGGSDAPGPVGGVGVAQLSQAVRFESWNSVSIGPDLWFQGRVRRATG